MYRVNQNITYHPNRGRWNSTVRFEEKQNIYVNQNQSFHIDFPNIFTHERIPYFEKYQQALRDKWEKGDYMSFWSSQLFFAVHCATTALGISAEMLLDKSIPAIVNSILRFHVYYHIRRILHRLKSPTPLEDGFDAYNNNYSKGAFQKLCSEYGANPQSLYKFESNSHSWDEPGKEFFLIRPRDYAKWITPQSQGLTEHGLTKLSESIRLYTRLLLGSQFEGRASVLGSSAKNTSVRQLYLQEFESIIKRPEDLDSDLNEFNKLLKYARTPVNLVVVPQCYMMPSDLELHVGEINDWNNRTLVAPESSKIGEIQSVNSVVEQTVHRKKVTEELEQHEKVFAKEHENDKQALVIGLTAVIIGVFLYLKI